MENNAVLLLLVLLGLVFLFFFFQCKIKCHQDDYSHMELKESGFPDPGCYEGKDCPKDYTQIIVGENPRRSECCPMEKNAWVPPCIDPRSCPKGYKKVPVLGTFGREKRCCPKFEDCEPNIRGTKCPPGKQLVGRTYQRDGILPCCKISSY